MDSVIGGFCVLVVMMLIGWWYLWRKNNNLNQKKLVVDETNIKHSSSSSSSSSSVGEIPKGNSGWPWIGETLDFIACGYTSRPVSFMDKRTPLYGKVFKTHLLGKPIIVSTDQEVNKVVLQNNGSIFIPSYPKSISELLGKSSIIQMNGSLHKRVHGLIGGFFRSPQLKAQMTKEIEKCLLLSMDTWKDKNIIYIQEETKNMTFELLVKVLMSINPGEDLEFLKREFGEFIKGLICVPIKFPGTRLYKSLKAKDRLLKMVRRILEEKKMKMDKDEKGNYVIKDVMDVLLLDGTEEANDEIKRLPLDFIGGNIIEMMIPGEESVPMVMTIAVKYLGECPLALHQLMEENMELKRQKEKLGEEYNWSDYMALPFTQNVINESLRMANIVNGLWREALKDIQIKGYLIPKGWCVFASFSSVHMDEGNYENPYQFDPWRWERKPGVNSSSSFTPFGGGPRLCPGLEFSRLEIAIFLHHLVTRFSWEAKEDYIINFPTVKMKNKLPITVTPII